MQGRAPDDELLAVAWAVCVARSDESRLTRADAARQLGINRQTLSGYLNAGATATSAAYERMVEAGRLPAALARFGLEDGDEYDGNEGVSAAAFSITPAMPVTPQLVEAAAEVMQRDGLPPLHALIAAGADEVDAGEWLDEARSAAEQRRPGWPGDGWRLLRRVQVLVAGELLKAARGGRAGDFFRLGGIVDPVLFAPVDTGPDKRNPLEDLSDTQLVAVVGGDFGGDE